MSASFKREDFGRAMVALLVHGKRLDVVSVGSDTIQIDGQSSDRLVVTLEAGAKHNFSNELQELITEKPELSFLNEVVMHPATKIESLRPLTLQEKIQARDEAKEDLQSPDTPDVVKPALQKIIDEFGSERPGLTLGKLPRHRVTRDW